MSKKMSLLVFTIKLRFDENIGRVTNLLEAYSSLKLSQNNSSSGFTTDILRSAVVFLHATLEDLIRDAGRFKHNTAPAKFFVNIPLVGVSVHNRPEKFGLERLVKFRGTTVESIISDSVDKYLERLSFNNPTDVITFIQSLGVATKTLNPYFKDLSMMMKRRHDIVHQADRRRMGQPNQYPAQAIKQDQVIRWKNALKHFADKLFSELDG